MFGDLNADGKVDEQDKEFLSADLERYDVNGDGQLSYHDAAETTGIKYSNGSGINPLTQIEMAIGALGYRPKGFASPYGRTYPWGNPSQFFLGR